MPVPRSPNVPRRSPAASRRARRKEKDAAAIKAGGEPEMVKKMRASFISWASVCSALTVLDLLQGGGLGWSLFPTFFWGAFGVFPMYTRLWQAGYSWRDVLNRPIAPDAVQARAPGSKPIDLPPATTDEFGKQVSVIHQARQDRKAILGIMQRLPASEQKLLPDVVATVDGLLNRAEDLARMLHAMAGGVEDRDVGRLDEKIAATKRQEEGPERDRQLSLLERQRQALGDLVTRRTRVEEQIESCMLAMQNVRYDLLRLKSAGVAAVLDDLTHATQQARALSRDVDHAIAAAGEIREALGEGPAPR